MLQSTLLLPSALIHSIYSSLFYSTLCSASLCLSPVLLYHTLHHSSVSFSSLLLYLICSIVFLFLPILLFLYPHWTHVDVSVLSMFYQTSRFIFDARPPIGPVFAIMSKFRKNNAKTNSINTQCDTLYVNDQAHWKWPALIGRGHRWCNVTVCKTVQGDRTRSTRRDKVIYGRKVLRSKYLCKSISTVDSKRKIITITWYTLF